MVKPCIQNEMGLHRCIELHRCLGLYWYIGLHHCIYLSLHLIGMFNGGEYRVKVSLDKLFVSRLPHDHTETLVQEPLERDHNY